jgi:uncharacterized protein
MKTVGSGVRKIRVRDAAGAFRVIYIARLAGAVYVPSRRSRIAVGQTPRVSEKLNAAPRMTVRLPFDKEALAELCRRHHIRRLSLFGSVLKGAAWPDSDVDLLVEFVPGKEPGLLGLAAIEIELSQLLGGCPVDLRTPHDLSKYFRDEVLRTAEVQYEA